MPDEPKKIVEYVLIFLSGFLALGFFVYVTDIALSDFAFTYVSVGLSLAIFGLVSMLTRWRLRFTSRKSLYEGLGIARVILLCSVTAALSVGFILLHQSHVLIGLMHSLAPTSVMKLTQHTPLRGVMFAEARGELHSELDQRDGLFHAHPKKEKGLSIAQPYNLYVRLHLSDSTVYEGRIIRFDTTPSSDGFPVVLSPACRVNIEGKPKAESFIRIGGPGVYVTGKDLKFMELLESASSGCKRCYTPLEDGTKRTDTVCADS